MIDGRARGADRATRGRKQAGGIITQQVRRGAGVADIHAGLRDAYERIRALLAKATKDEASSRHEVGVIVSDIKQDTAKYGVHAVEQLAGARGTNVHTLYRRVGSPKPIPWPSGTP